MTLGQEFNAFGESLENEVTALERIENILYEVNMGGTAIGTGLNAPAGYAEALYGDTWRRSPANRSCWHLISSRPRRTRNHSCFYSSVLKSLAIKLSKICNDLRLLASGSARRPGEINLPANAAGLEHHAGQGQPGDS